MLCSILFSCKPNTLSFISMANLPRFGRAWNRFSSLPRPTSAAQPTYESEPPRIETEIPSSGVQNTLTLQPFEPNPPPKVSSLPSSPVRESSRLHSPAKRLPSPSPTFSPKYKHTTARLASPPAPTKLAAPSRSPSPPYRRYNNGHRISPTSSPKNTKRTAKTTPPLSPKYRSQPAVPLSPLTLPRSEVKPATITQSRSPPEAEHKSVLYRKTAEKPTKLDRHSEYTSGKPAQKHPADVINIKGENVGAVMHISQSSEGEEIIKKKHRETSSYENNDKRTGGKDEREKKLDSLPMKSFMNSNFQGVNNSLLYNSSCSHRDPGLHLSLSRKTTHDHDREKSAHDSWRSRNED